MEDKVIKFGNYAHNISQNIENVLYNYEDNEAPLDFYAGYAACNLTSLECLAKEDEINTEDVALTLANLVEVGMAGAAHLLGMKDKVSRLANQMTDLYARKNRDYGNSFDKSMDKWGLPVAAIRIGDKENRLQSLIAKRGEADVKDESLADTFIDLSCYAIMTLMWMEGKAN